jgi:putative membrane protein
MKSTMKGVLLAAMMIVAAGCGSTTNDTTNDPAGAMTSASAINGMSGGMMEAPDIAAVMTVANMGEIEQAQAATPRLSTQAARDFAGMMIADHSTALQEAQALFSAENIIPRQSNPAAKMLRQQSDGIVASLNRNGTADRQYMQSQVDVHQQLLTMIDTQLIPAARGDLLALLQKQRASVAAHLDHARQILTGLP